jgi:hypothetical protein
MTNAEQVIALHRAGKSQRAIAKSLGVSQAAICKRLRRLKLIPPTQNQPPQLRNNQRESDNLDWASLPLDALLSAAFHRGAYVYFDEGQVVFRLPPTTMPLELRTALRSHSQELSLLIESRAAPLPACKSCGNRLWWREQHGIACATCTPPQQAQGLTWVWCSR